MAGRRRDTPFRLVQDTISTDTVEALSQLLDLAKDGEIMGIAFVAMYRRREYIVNAAGETLKNPTFSRGMLASLDDFFRGKINT